MQGFFIFHLLSGGLGLLLPERLSVGDGESKLVLSVYPTQHQCSTSANRSCFIGEVVSSLRPAMWSRKTLARRLRQ
jgi:hypothetical protein